MDVVVTNEMEDAVNEQPAKLRLKAVLIEMRLALSCLGADHHVAEVSSKGGWVNNPFFERKRQDIRGLVLIAPLLIEGVDGLVVCYDDGEFERLKAQAGADCLDDLLQLRRG